MPDLSRTKSTRQPNADGTKAEDNRQLTELLLQNKVSLKPTTAEPVDTHLPQPFFSRIKTWLLLFIALPFALLAYFSTRTSEDDFYA
ncbi:hypothetical protein GAO09_02210 [Rhizobiales bacterium RZME27]|jgi:hypothetical protein|uniref:Uncharacterized protein n=1 Tax=Endobacterium cereale TaxID=2663029 RepID=A0A6A8A505_9HYPH|nr:hypothetical protein [Endobacterium cereale]MEB2844975.1 hypothetical protein [Endobacterium cereale]MQY44887.1 hypothetical protein [Endobacterium cereale]